MRNIKVAAGLLAIATGALFAAGCDPKASGSDQSADNTYDISDKVSTLSLSGRGGNVTLTASDGASVKVSEELKYDDAKPKTSHSVDGGTLNLVDSGCGKDNCHVDYRIELPAGTVVKIKTDGGDITGSGLGADATVNTNGGNIDLSYATPAPLVDVTSSGGDVKVKVPAGPYEVDASTDGGNKTVSVQAVAGSAHKIKAKSGGGDVSVVS
ncbi:hypothetical protein ACWT_0900 [Actinoplanes sp. SE50]|uniref:DUF4097 family beta strand repeat-containing protein n=1 Tax=unclassified Actinoplanes TaxID=2626549 RepID=UPI00023EC3E5|nr:MULTISPECIES: DUF4097 family beta strand repeat-containing protein [unclassified Actinoplanes]AEV81915.1 hypothetical protein ACPL_1018 [Actinoplanes sp. SE50/110]ATO80315.1 hypothetical protein ACWT_0900 [Actinoplanes sp. SE50]SLL97720.1 uncharacterized protein ACSP50_0929 [Actinoplanes sp. SE50/110]